MLNKQEFVCDSSLLNVLHSSPVCSLHMKGLYVLVVVPSVYLLVGPTFPSLTLVMYITLVVSRLDFVLGGPVVDDTRIHGLP